MRPLLPIIAAALFFSGTANAAFVHQDFLAPGDNKATLHEETGLEWLKLSETKGRSIDYVSSQLGVGGRFYGWRLPTGEEVEAVLGAIVPIKLNNSTPDAPTTSQARLPYDSAWIDWTTLFGKTYFSSTTLVSYGLYVQNVGSNSKILMSGMARMNSINSLYDDSNGGYSSATAPSQNIGVFLVKNSTPIVTPPSDVPAPLSAAFLGLCAMLAANGRNRRLKR